MFAIIAYETYETRKQKIQLYRIYERLKES